MATTLYPGDVVRSKGDDREMAVEETAASGRVRCVWLRESGPAVGVSFDASALELVWRGERQPVLLRAGDVVQLPILGPLVDMTVEQASEGKIRCLWFNRSGLLAHWFPPETLWIRRATDDPTARLNAGDVVLLRSGGPSMTVEADGTAQVRCVFGSGVPIWLDPRTLSIEPLAALAMTAQELVTFAHQNGVDLAAICHDHSFHHKTRFIYFWRKTRSGVIYYNTQGSVKLLPDEFRESANAFRGMWHEAGYVQGLGRALAFVKAWVLDGREVDELPARCRQRWGIG
jgi:uncharacterized protein YodC (DUF2158 family)